VVTKLDRLARSMRDLLRIVHAAAALALRIGEREARHPETHYYRAEAPPLAIGRGSRVRLSTPPRQTVTTILPN
jgi:hypothetical protein